MCLDKVRFAQTFVKGSYDVCKFAGRSATEKPDHRCRRLLGARRDRPLTSAPPSSVNASSPFDQLVSSCKQLRRNYEAE